MAATPTPSNVVWRKSTSSGAGVPAVEVAVLGPTVFIRDSSDPTGTILNFSHEQWIAFVGREKAEYAVILGPSAIRTIRGLSAEEERKRLGDALRKELKGGLHEEKQFIFESDGVSYTATPLSFRGYTAIHRPMTKGEIDRLREDRTGKTAGNGFYVIDILSMEYAWVRTPRHRDRLAHARSEAKEGEVQRLSEDDLDSLFRN
jgi:hypothetical protein